MVCPTLADGRRTAGGASRKVVFPPTERPNPLLHCSPAIRMGYIDYVPSREEFDCALDGSPARPSEHAISTWMPILPFCSGRDTLPFRDDKGRPGWDAHTGTRLPRAIAEPEKVYPETAAFK